MKYGPEWVRAILEIDRLKADRSRLQNAVQLLCQHSGKMAAIANEAASLREKYNTAKSTIAHFQEVLSKRTKQLNAMHWVWCSGGCEHGVESEDRLSPETLRLAIRNTVRLIAWTRNYRSKHGETLSPLTDEELDVRDLHSFYEGLLHGRGKLSEEFVRGRSEAYQAGVRIARQRAEQTKKDGG